MPKKKTQQSKKQPSVKQKKLASKHQLSPKKPKQPKQPKQPKKKPTIKPKAQKERNEVFEPVAIELEAQLELNHDDQHELDTTSSPKSFESSESTESSESEEKAEASAPRAADPTQIYLSEIGYTPLLTPEQEVYYARLVQKGDLKAREVMIKSNLRLVVKIARRYYNRGLEFLDLIEEGNLGLLRAVEKFDPERGFRFSTYATWWIRQTIERAIMNQTRTIRLPIHVVRELNSYLSAAREILKKTEHTASYQEIADVVHKPVGDVKDMMELNEHMISLDSIINSESTAGRPLMEAIADKKNPDPSETIAEERIVKQLEESMHELNDKQQEVLARRFGLGGHDRQTLEEVGEAIGLTRERVRQIQMNGLKALREIMEERGINWEED